MGDAKKIFQCANCRNFMDYQLTLVMPEKTVFTAGYERWCDDCLAQVKSRSDNAPDFAEKEKGAGS